MRPNLTTRIATLALAGALASASMAADDFPIFDGKPKTVFIPNHFSWKMGNILGGDYGFGYYGYNYISGENFGDRTNAFPIKRDLTVDSANGWWMWDKDVQAQVQAAAAKGPVILVMVGDPGFLNRGPGDTAAINLGARMLQRASDELKRHGFSMVFFYSEHYRKLRARDTSTLDVANDSLFINAYNQLTRSHYGVNATTPGMKVWPLDVVSDMEHPQNWTKAEYSTAIIEAMLAHDGKSINDSLKRATLDGRLAAARQSADLVGNLTVTWAAPGPQKPGGQVKVSVQGYQDSLRPRVALLAFQGGRAMEYVLDSALALAKAGAAGYAGERTYVLPDSAPLLMYSPVADGRIPVFGDSACIMVVAPYLDPGGGTINSNYKLSAFVPLLKRDGTPWRPVGLAPRPRTAALAMPSTTRAIHDAMGRLYRPDRERRTQAIPLLPGPR